MDDFTERRRLRARRSAHGGLVPVFAECLLKGDRHKLYRIDPLGPSLWRCEVLFGSAVHRTIVAESKPHMLMLKREYQREVDDLLHDGWRRDADT